MPNSRDSNYSYRIRISLVIVLMLVIGFTIAALHIPFNRQHRSVPQISTISVYPVVAPTTQGSPAQVPSRPDIPIPVPMEDVPEPEPTDDFQLSFDEFNVGQDLGGAGNQPGFQGSGNPRPLVEVLPEYPDKLRRQGISGIVELGLLVNHNGLVDSVWVLRNTTENPELEQLAINAAAQSQYMPLSSEGEINLKVIRQYRFRSR